MAVEKLYLTGIPGSTFISDGRLAYVEILLVMREGKMLVETGGVPTGKQFRHVEHDGEVLVDNDIPVGPGGEEFYFEYKTV